MKKNKLFHSDDPIDEVVAEATETDQEGDVQAETANAETEEAKA